LAFKIFRNESADAFEAGIEVALDFTATFVLILAGVVVDFTVAFVLVLAGVVVGFTKMHSPKFLKIKKYF
jgi:hypothetical protein